jgi:LacI family transcriptional regulator
MNGHGRPRGRKRARPAGIKEIAAALDISIGTVDRALHDRPGISPATRAEVLKMAKVLGYRPNLAARFLSSRKQLRIAVNLPREIASFFDVVRDGIRDAARSFEPNGVRVLYRSYPRLGEGETEALQAALEDEVHGLVIAPGRPDALRPLVQRAVRRGIAVVCVSTDAPGTERLTAVSVDPITNGSLVGELMGRFLGGEGRVVLVTGLVSTADHAGKLDGFRRTAAEMWPRLEIAAVIEAHDDEVEAYEKCREAFAASRDVAGLYVSTANSMPVMRALEDAGLSGKVTVVTTDLFPALAPLIESGKVAATIHQRPWMQGQLAFQTVYRYLVEHVSPPPVTPLAPHIVMRSTLHLFLDRMRSDAASSVRGAAGASERADAASPATGRA